MRINKKEERTKKKKKKVESLFLKKLGHDTFHSIYLSIFVEMPIYFLLKEK